MRMMSQTKKNQQNLNSPLAYATTRLTNSMELIQFQPLGKLRQYSLTFHPINQKAMELQNHRNFSYKVSWQVVFSLYSQSLSFRIRISQLMDEKGQQLLQNYLLLGQQFLTQINCQTYSSKKLWFDYNMKSLNIFIGQCYIPCMIEAGFIKYTWTQIKKQIIQKLIINFHQCQALILEERDRLEYMQFKFEQNRSFFQDGAKRIFSNEKLLAHENIVASVRTVLVTEKQQIMKLSERIRSVNLQMDRHIQSSIREVKLMEQNSKQLHNQFKYSIYDKVLKNLQKGQDKPDLQFVKKNETYSICQGIQNPVKLQTSNTIRMSAGWNLSIVEINQYQFKYQISVHNHVVDSATTDSANLQTPSRQVSLQQMFPEKRQYEKAAETLKLFDLQNDINVAKLAVKMCIKKDNKKIYEPFELNRIRDAELSFLNQYDFIKYIRDKVFPYIMKYLLEVQNSDQKYKAAPEKRDQHILNKKIYMKAYMHSLQYMLSPNQNDFNRYFMPDDVQKILKIMFQVAATLRFLDRLHILHRDIKPSNIMVDQHFNIKFIDWGSCCTREDYKTWVERDLLSTNETDTTQRLFDYLKKLQNKNSDETISEQQELENSGRKEKKSKSNISRDKHDSGKRMYKNKKSKQQAAKFPKRPQRLLTTEGWSQSAVDFKKQSKQLFASLFKDKKTDSQTHKQDKNNEQNLSKQNDRSFEQNYFFDVYSFGKIVDKFINLMSSKFAWNNDFWLMPHLEYLKNICLQINPYKRLCPMEILLYVSELIKIVKKKNQLIKKGSVHEKGQMKKTS